MSPPLIQIVKSDYVITRDQFHYFFNRDHKPILHVKPGDTVRCELNDVSHGQITKDTKSRPGNMDRKKCFPLAGPVFVDGAKPGDSLVVSILDMKTVDYGWSGIYPVYCLPYTEDPEYAQIDPEGRRPYLHVWDLSDGKYARFNDRIKVPIVPFPGTIGVAPKESGNPDAKSGLNGDGTDMTAFRHGGNMDIRHLTVGSKLILPVYAEGALFSCGDPHAAQAEGELDTAIESPSEVLLSFDIEHKTIPNPRFFSAEADKSRDGPYFGFTGNAPNIVEATLQARTNLIMHLRDEYDLSLEDAYMLVGVIADLRIQQCVNGPNWTVALMVPKSILGIK
jgi:acetamidase/formamidase